MQAQTNRNQRIIQRYAEGYGNSEIAKMFNTTEPAIAGVIRRHRERTAIEDPGSTAKRDAKIIKMHKAGERMKTIGAAFGIHYMKVVFVLRSAGLLGVRPPRPISGLHDRGVKRAPDIDYGNGFEDEANIDPRETLGRVSRAVTHVHYASSAATTAEV